MNKVGTAYLLWLGILVGLGGLHRLYNGKIGTGLLWLFTWGLFGVGQFVDLMLLPRMVDEHNLKFQTRLGLTPEGEFGANVPALTITSTAARTELVPLTGGQLTIKLIKAAEERGGKLTVTQAVMVTGIGFKQAEAVLQEMVRTGYVEMDNDPATGAVVYEFRELREM